MNPCDHKSTYPGKGTAKRYARRLMNRYGKLWPYRCTHCNRWHLTSRPPLVRTVDVQHVAALPRSRGKRRGRRLEPSATVEEIRALAARMRTERTED